MTKAEYIDFIRNSLPMVDQTNRFHENQIAVAINMAVNTVFWDMYEQNPRKMAKSMERYTTTITLTPLNNVVRGRYAVVIDHDIVDLPRKTGGVISIRQWDGLGVPSLTTTTTNYVPVTVMEGEQFYGSESSLTGVVVGFSWSKIRQLEFWGMSATEASNTIEVRFIKQFKGYSFADDVLLPYGQNERIIELVRQYLGLIPIKDIVNDNADIPVSRG